MDKEGERRAESQRFVSLGAALLASGATGVTYAFSVYSGGLKKRFDLTQAQIDTIGLLPWVGGALGWLTGMVNDRMGPSFACALGGSLLTGIEVLYWAIGSGRISCESPDVALAAIGPFINISTGFMVAAVFATLVRNFPNNRGAAVGLGKGWVGLFSGASTQVFGGLFFVPDSDDPASIDYVLFCAALIFLLAVLPSPLVRILPPQTPDAEGRGAALLRRRLQCGFGVVVACAAVVAAAAVLKDSMSQAGHLAVAVVILVLWALLPPLVNLPERCACGAASDVGSGNDDDPVGAGSGDDGTPRQRIASGSHSAYSSHSRAWSEADHLALTKGKGEKGVDGEDGDDDGMPELTLPEMLRTPDCWLLWFAATVTIGGGTMLTTNLGQITDATGDGSSASAVTLFSVGQALSRMAAGVASDAAVARWGVSRPLCLAAAPLLMAAAHLVLLAAGSSAMLYVGVLLAGGGFGATWPLMVVLVSELFGRRNLGGNYMVFDGFTGAIGSLTLAKFLPQTIYADHVAHAAGAPAEPAGSSSSGSGDDCEGRACFAASFAIIAALAVAAAAAACALHYRNRALYARITGAARRRRRR